MKIRLEKVIDLNDWDQLVKETYGRPYSFQQQDGCRERGNFRITVPDKADDYQNKFVPEEVNNEDVFGVSFAAWLARDPKQQIPNEDTDWALELWWERNFYPDIQMVANDLHKRGLLEAGEYTIDIDW